MDLEQGLTVELEAIAGLADKVFPMAADQGTKAPYLTYTLSSNDRTKTLSGHDGLVQAQYQLDFFHSTPASLKALKKLLIASLKTYDLRNIGGSGPLIQQIEIINESEFYDDGAELYKGVIEFDIHYTE